MSEFNEKGVSNNKTFRGVSDRLDSFMQWEGERKAQSGFRGAIHGVYHSAVGVGKLAFFNVQGSMAEFRRAG